MVAGQHTETARVDREALVEPELGREVRDAEPIVLLTSLPPRAAVQLGLCAGKHLLKTRQDIGPGSGSELLVGECVKERGRVVVVRGEAHGVELLEEGARAGQPAEPK